MVKRWGGGGRLVAGASTAYRRASRALGRPILALALALGACAPKPPVPAVATADAAGHAAVSDRLYFGRAIPGGGTVSEEDWQTFLRDVVTPMFPEGLTEWRAHGQWRDASGQIVREESFVLELIHAPDAVSDQNVTIVIAAYKQRFRQESVLRVLDPVQVDF